MKSRMRFSSLSLSVTAGLLTIVSCSHSANDLNVPLRPEPSASEKPLKPLTSPRFEVTTREDTGSPGKDMDTKAATAAASDLKKTSKPKLLWVSLDGMKREDVVKFTATLKNPHPNGFRFLLGKGRKWASVRVTNPSITSSSHASTITCAPPGLHGIVDNGQWNGVAMESGFDKPYATETFVAALRKSGKRVGVLGYPGFDAKTENRTADFAVAYDNPPVRPQFLALSGEEPLSFAIESRVNLGTKHPAKATLDPKSNKVTVDLGPSGRHQVGTTTWTDVVFEEAGVRQLVSMRVFVKPENRAASAPSAPPTTLYVSATTRNNASPEAFRKELDAKGIVFSAGKNYRVRSEFGDEAFLRTLEHRLSFFESAGLEMLTRDGADAFFLYLEDLDVLGHQYAGDPNADTLRAAHFAKVDQTLGKLLSRVPESTNVLIVGDHGMSAVQYELAAGALLPSEARGRFIVKASGGALFLYGTEKGSLLSPAPVEEPWFKATVKALNDWRLPTNAKKALFTKVVVKGSPAAQSEGWTDVTPLPWIAAFATPGIGLKETTETSLLVSLRKGAVLPPELRAQAAGGDASRLGEPVPYGQHGHDSDSLEMMTNVVTFGPRFEAKARHLGARTTNLALVPFVADALGWPRPEACARIRP